MSLPEKPVPVLPCFSILYRDDSIFQMCTEDLILLLGEPVLKSGVFPFDMTCYYSAEMGNDLKRRWLCFNLGDPGDLSSWKFSCIEIEGKYGGEGNRTVNIDPGYLDHSKLILASCKPAPDKVYLSGGIYAHMCLRYRRGDYHAPDHSFADFSDGRFNGFFGRAKLVYRRLLRETQR